MQQPPPLPRTAPHFSSFSTLTATAGSLASSALVVVAGSRSAASAFVDVAVVALGAWRLLLLSLREDDDDDEAAGAADADWSRWSRSALAEPDDEVVDDVAAGGLANTTATRSYTLERMEWYSVFFFWTGGSEGMREEGH